MKYIFSLILLLVGTPVLYAQSIHFTPVTFSNLYIGDGHAAQGDGEIAGNALETSMDVIFSVRLIRKGTMPLNYPRAEDDKYIMAMGVHKELKNALKIASANLLDWLQYQHDLTLQEATQVMSTTIEYTIAEIADPEQMVVAKIEKKKLKDLPLRR
ncbi:acetamidase/formamidase family protein [Chitinophaga pinensis]|uniref:Acetamidase n=1 Tax=Chitinophaga pinensis TaxID=79329 RepID=A0A5C6LVC4_9BACT|nr:acetamidase/formamidase family protein [Chitinophaga pinensis]TWW01345.1 hypothetical protein FEF09_07775 [Chitinophaga pinensis]